MCMLRNVGIERRTTDDCLHSVNIPCSCRGQNQLIPMVKKKKLVRRQSLSTRLANYPLDLLLSLSESVELVDWDAQAYSWGLPAGGACCVLLMLCRIYSSLSSSDPSKNVEDTLFVSRPSSRDALKMPRRRPFFTVVFSTLSFILLVLTILNTVDCIRKKRKYTLMGRAVGNEPDTPSARKIRYEDPLQDEYKRSGSPFRRIVDNWTSQSKEQGEELWELNVWDPPKFNLYFGSTFSPLHALYILYGPLGAFQLVMLTALSGWIFGLTYMFETMVKDKAIIHSEVLGEYGKKVVKPITAAAKRDVAVGTDGSFEFYSPTPHGSFSPRDVRESRSRVSMTPTPASPWKSPIKPQMPITSSTPLAGKSLRQRASMNSLSTRLHPAGYSSMSSSPRRSEPPFTNTFSSPKRPSSSGRLD